MRALVQRVVRAEVSSRASPEDGWEVVGAIQTGLCAFVGVTHGDSVGDADKLAAKLFGVRLLDDEAGIMNLSLSDLLVASAPVPLGVLVVSQFTLYGDARKGRRPSWAAAAPPEAAEPLVDRVVERLRALGADDGLLVATGRFRTEMRVELVNDGPVTVLLEV